MRIHRFDLKIDRFEITIHRFDLKIARFEIKIVRFEMKTARFKPSDNNRPNVPPCRNCFTLLLKGLYYIT